MAKNILIIADNPTVATLLKARLNAGDHVLTIVPAAPEGLSAAEEISPGLIIIDIDAAGTGGFTLAQKLRAGPATKNTPIVVFSAHEEAVSRQKAMDRGNTFDYVVKPFRAEELVEKIERSLRGAAAKRGKILVIDDNARIGQLLKGRLEANAYEVATALTGQEGLDKAKEERPDLILLDLNLPDMDGLDVGRGLREHILTKDIPLIIVTAREGESVRRRAVQELPTADYLTKPFRPEVLLEKIALHLEQRRAGPGTTPAV